MNPVQAQVLEFHKAGGHLINDRPTTLNISAETELLRFRLTIEEFEELCGAMAARDIAGIAKELADMLYIIYGTAISYGIDMQPISDEVHRSNMTKFGKPGEYQDTCDASGKSIKDAGGKTLKPSTYEPPNLEPILATQLPLGQLITRPGQRFAFGKTRETTTTWVACCHCEQSQAIGITLGEKSHCSIVCNLCETPYVLIDTLVPTYGDSPKAGNYLR